MFEKLGSLPRRLRWALHRWTAAADREFHDGLFSAQRYNPFSFAYPGYVTIRRFAELTEPHLRDVRHAIDLGCGPGEITCELARRNPSISFVGVDHSEAAIARAREHTKTLALSNIEFLAADVSTFTPDSADIILMYDSFHHLLDPAAFVRRLTTRVPGFLLVEPAGDWLGGWQKTLEFDWIPRALDDIRARLAWQMNEDGLGPAQPGHETDERGQPVEHRYTVDDLKTFFDGYGLEARGTIAGLGEYPPNPYGAGPLREEFGRITADTMRAIDELLLRQNIDLHAKHWVIHAERGAPHRLRTPRPMNPRADVPQRRSVSAYDVEYSGCRVPDAVAAASVFEVVVTLKNRGWRPLRSDIAVGPVFVSYHWLAAGGSTAVHDGRRTPLPNELLPGDSVTLAITIEAPPQPGRYTLAVDLVEEGVTWFSGAGVPMIEVPVTIR